MSESKQPNDKRPRSFSRGTFYHIVTVGDPNFRLPENLAEAVADPNRVIESRTEVTPLGTHHYRVIRADTTIRPRRASIPYTPPSDPPPQPPAQDAPAEPTTDEGGAATAGS